MAPLSRVGLRIDQFASDQRVPIDHDPVRRAFGRRPPPMVKDEKTDTIRLGDVRNRNRIACRKRTSAPLVPTSCGSRR